MSRGLGGLGGLAQCLCFLGFDLQDFHSSNETNTMKSRWLVTNVSQIEMQRWRVLVASW